MPTHIKELNKEIIVNVAKAKFFFRGAGTCLVTWSIMLICVSPYRFGLLFGCACADLGAQVLRGRLIASSGAWWGLSVLTGPDVHGSPDRLPHCRTSFEDDLFVVTGSLSAACTTR